jgi:hypothetical protein
MNLRVAIGSSLTTPTLRGFHCSVKGRAWPDRLRNCLASGRVPELSRACTFGVSPSRRGRPSPCRPRPKIPGNPPTNAQSAQASSRRTEIVRGSSTMLPLFRGLVNCPSEEFPREPVSVFVVKNRPVDLWPKLLQDVPGAVEGKLRTPALIRFDPRTRASGVVGVANAGRRARPADFRNIERVSPAVCVCA